MNDGDQMMVNGKSNQNRILKNTKQNSNESKEENNKKNNKKLLSNFDESNRVEYKWTKIKKEFFYWQQNVTSNKLWIEKETKSWMKRWEEEEERTK